MFKELKFACPQTTGSCFSSQTALCSEIKIYLGCSMPFDAYISFYNVLSNAVSLWSDLLYTEKHWHALVEKQYRQSLPPLTANSVFWILHKLHFNFYNQSYHHHTTPYLCDENWNAEPIKIILVEKYFKLQLLTESSFRYCRVSVCCLNTENYAAVLTARYLRASLADLNRHSDGV